MDQGRKRLGRAGRVITLTVLPLLGCSEPPKPPPPAMSLKQAMEWVIDPAADAVWEPVKTIITEKGTQEIAPQTQEQWDNVRNGAATLVAAGDLLMSEGYARDRGEWFASARRLIDTAKVALKAAEAKNAQAVFAAGGDIYNACAACHRRYAPQLNAQLSE